MFKMLPDSSRIWLGIGLGALGAALASVVLERWLDAEPCHLCITQRALLLLVVPFALAAWGAWPRRAGLLAGVAAVGAALTGGVIAARQSLLERQPPEMAATCAGLFEPTPSERIAAWLGDAIPWLFAANGSCDDMGATFLGLSFANAAFVAFGAVAGVGTITIVRRYRAGGRGRRNLQP